MVSSINANTTARYLNPNKISDSKAYGDIKSAKISDSYIVELSDKAKSKQNINNMSTNHVKVPEPKRNILENVFRLISEGKSLPDSDYGLSWDTVRSTVKLEVNYEEFMPDSPDAPIEEKPAGLQTEQPKPETREAVVDKKSSTENTEVHPKNDNKKPKTTDRVERSIDITVDGNIIL